MRKFSEIKDLNLFIRKLSGYSLHLNEIRINLAANLERSHLSHSYSYDSADDRPTLFARFPLTKSPGAILNARQRGPQGGGQDARSNFVPFMQYAG